MPDALARWHDFYLLLGGAAATLVGLTFVAASIGAGTMNREHETALNIFVTPTVLHFTAILIACLLIVAPIGAAAARAGLVLALSAAGLVYSVAIWFRMHRKGFAARVDLRDRMWYALAPVFAYAVLASGAALDSRAAAAAGAVVASGLGLLLLAGIRNAWDMVIFIIVRKE